MPRTLAEIRRELEDAEKAQAQAERTNRENQMRSWRDMVNNPDNWEWRVSPYTYRGFINESDLEGLHIQRRVNPEALAAWKASGPATFSSDWEDGTYRGMFYYRTDEGILTHAGGGHCILKDPKLCSDAEWADMVAGFIPMKFRK